MKCFFKRFETNGTEYIAVASDALKSMVLISTLPEPGKMKAGEATQAVLKTTSQTEPLNYFEILEEIAKSYKP